jgi:hypothetical protein
VVLVLAAVAAADPLPREDVTKFIQKPMVQTTIQDPTGAPVDYFGHDELSTAWWAIEPGVAPLYAGRFMADDFADTFDKPVVHVRWWGSYLNQQTAAPGRVQQFLIAFETDVPADPAGDPYSFSHPGDPILTQIVRAGPLTPQSGTFTERQIHPGGPPRNEPLYEYNAELAVPFAQLPDTIYWIKIVALVDWDPQFPEQRIEWGWHNRDYTVMNPFASPNVVPGEQIIGEFPDGTLVWHFQDDAVSGAIENIQQVGPMPWEVHMDQDHWASTNPSMNDEHYLDGVDGPEGIGRYSKDLAFELFTVPDPATLALVGLGAALAVRRRRRAR